MKSCRRSAVSPTPPSADQRAGPDVADAIGAVDAVVAVACSGGRDSTALLHAVLQATADTEVQVVALHVHHGLSPNADTWLQHCRDQCRRFRRRAPHLRFDATRVDTRPATGDSIEAWARQVRYAALQRMAVSHRAALLLLAHHRRDQAETLLLQALRGGGLAGLAAMPRTRVRDGLCWARPWIDEPREAIEAYVRRHRLRWIDDESNDDDRLARNRLRRQVWPVLCEAFPAAEATLARSSEWAQESLDILADVARTDLAQVATPTGIDIAAWLALSRPRRSLSLRTWLLEATGTAAPATLVIRLLDELPTARRGASWPCGAHRLARDATQLRVLDAVAVAPSSTPRECALSIEGAGRIHLPGWGGTLEVSDVPAGGVALSRLDAIQLRSRSGGERFQAGPGRPARSLKKQYQGAGLTGDDRGGPLLFIGDDLVFVPGLGIDARMLAAAGEAQVALRWLPEGPGRVARHHP